MTKMTSSRKIKVWDCQRCGHEWASRLPNKPRACAKCKSTSWDNPKVKKVKMPTHPFVVGRGRPKLLPSLENLRIGDKMFIPFHLTEWGEPDDRKNKSMATAIHRHKRRKGQQLNVSYINGGINIERVL